MTLMELMAGIVITAIATAAGFGTFSAIIDSRERATASTLEAQSAASNRNLLASWFAAGRYVRDSGSALPTMSIGSAEADDAIRIITTAPTPLVSQQTQIYLYIDRDPFTPENGLVAEFTALNQPIDSVLMMVVSKKMEINPRVMGMEVTLLDPTTREWVSQFELPTGTPLGMSITLYPEWRDTLPALLRIPFVYPLGTTR
jgi:type II secretory pathway pseudopilin PulG